MIPSPGDTLLIVEIADTSQHRDRAVKLPRHAAAGIPEVWIVDVHREPSPEGSRTSRRLPRGESVAPQAFPDVALEVDDVLG
jgi:Uma2 family endonuclease